MSIAEITANWGIPQWIMAVLVFVDPFIDFSRDTARERVSGLLGTTLQFILLLMGGFWK